MVIKNFQFLLQLVHTVLVGISYVYASNAGESVRRAVLRGRVCHFFEIVRETYDCDTQRDTLIRTFIMFLRSFYPQIFCWGILSMHARSHVNEEMTIFMLPNLSQSKTPKQKNHQLALVKQTSTTTAMSELHPRLIAQP